MKTAIVFGGYGVFGAQVVRGLVERGVPVVVAGRDGRRAEAFAREVGARAMEADARTPPSEVVSPEHVVVNCAGPFSEFGTALLEACAANGAHHVDIADDRGYAARVRALAPRFTRSAAVYGCSSLPAISQALTRVLAAGRPSAAKPSRIRVILFIGNNNPKGAAAIQSLTQQLGRPFSAPQGTLRGFGSSESVDLPVFGRRRVYDFECADYDLLPAESISVQVGFELGLAARTFALMARLSPHWGKRASGLLQRVGSLRFGSSGGVVQVEVFENGAMRRASMSGASGGQRMAVLPAILAVQALAEGREASGVLTASDLLGARAMLDAMVREGFELEVSA